MLPSDKAVVIIVLIVALLILSLNIVGIYRTITIDKAKTEFQHCINKCYILKSSEEARCLNSCMLTFGYNGCKNYEVIKNGTIE